MRTRMLGLALVAFLVMAAPAVARTATETVTVGQVTATLTYDYDKTRYGLANFENVHVVVDRAGARLADKTLGDECRGCSPWPAAAGADGEKSISLRDLDNDEEPEVLIELYSGGANCCYYSDTFRYDAVQNKYIEKVLRPGLSFPYVLEDLNGDNVPEFRSVDYRFAYKYGSNADTPRPLRIFDWDHGRLVDVTLAYPGMAATDAGEMYKIYLQFRKVKDANVRGVLAAYLADSYNAGNGRVAWRRVVAAYRRGDVDKKFADDSGPFGRKYLESLRSFLKRLGYLKRA